jgi:hypothetical protein
MSEGNDREVLHAVSARFPKAGAAIRRLFHEDEQFHELCADYTECVGVLDRLHRDQGAPAERIEQYCELRVNIERELVSRVSEAAREWARSRGTET